MRISISDCFETNSYILIQADHDTFCVQGSIRVYSAGVYFIQNCIVRLYSLRRRIQRY